MTITRKEIITKIHVEITMEEFKNAYDAMMKQLYHKEIKEALVPVEKIVKYAEATDAMKSVIAEESFKSLFGVIHSATIRYIARQNGLEIDNYGYVNSHTGLLECTMMQSGAHM